MREAPLPLPPEEQERLLWLACRYKPLRERPEVQELLNGRKPASRSERLLLEEVLRAKEAREEIVLHNLRLVYRFVTRYAPLGRAAGLTQEDLLHHGVEGLLEAVDTFNPHLGYRFATWAYHKVRWAIQRAIKVRTGREVSLEEPLEGTEDLTLGETLASSLPSPAEVVEANLLEERLRKEVPGAELLTQEVLTLEDLARLEGVSSKAMRERLRRALRRNGASV